MIKPLTSLRFFFAMMVLLSHLPYSFNNLFYKVISNGPVGVSFFFILSGFILTYNYENKFLENFDKKKFWIDRFLRVYPLHLVMLILFTCGILFTSDNHKLLLKQFLAQFFLVQNYIPIKEIYSSLNKPAWSICCEMFFYFIFPFIVLKIRKRWAHFILILFIFPIILYYINSDNSLFIGINPLVRLPDFIVGIISYRFYHYAHKYLGGISSIQYSWLELGSLILLGSSLLIFYNLDYYRIFPLYWIPMVFFILTMSISKGIFAKFLSNKFLFLLGEISYSVYMTHFFVIFVLTNFFRDSAFFTSRLTLISAAIFITLVFSYLTYKVIEIKFSRFAKPIAYKASNTRNVI